MNKYRINIIRFLDGDMSSNEKQIFENEIQMNTDLKKEYERIRRTLEFFNPASLDLNSHYYQTILPRFHDRRIEGMKIEVPFIKKFAFNFLPAVIVLIVTYIGFSNIAVNNQTADEFLSQNRNSIANELSDEEIMIRYGQTADIIESKIAEEKLDKEFSTLFSDTDSELYLFNSSLTELSSLFENLSDDEYEELISSIDI